MELSDRATSIEMHVTPPASADKMPVVPPPGSPGGDPTVKPK
jgi:hypothetical protein